MITNINPRSEDFEESIRALNYSCIAKDIKPMKSVIPKLAATNELKLQIKKEKKLNEIQSNNNTNNNNNNIFDKKNDEINSEYNNNNYNTLSKNDHKLNDSLTLNLNELFNSNSNFDDMIDHEIKTEFTKAPEDISTKEEIAKLVNEIKKLREEVSEFKSDNSEFQKSKIFGLQSETQSLKGNLFDKNKLTYMNNNLRPFSQISQSENNLKILGNNDLNLPAFNCNDSILSQELSTNFPKINPNANNFFSGINNTLQNNSSFDPINNINNINNMNNINIINTYNLNNINNYNNNYNNNNMINSNLNLDNQPIYIPPQMRNNDQKMKMEKNNGNNNNKYQSNRDEKNKNKYEGKKNLKKDGKSKKPFEVRAGDWNCTKCSNLNFSFRSKCNRCGLPKEMSEQGRDIPPEMIYNQNNQNINYQMMGNINPNYAYLNNRNDINEMQYYQNK
jgi:hypothetical protein